jgi:hypothetical protein
MLHHLASKMNREGRCILGIASTALFNLLLMAAQFSQAAEPAAVMHFSCSGSAEANDSRRPVKKIELTINILERTVTVSGLSVVAHVDSADDVNILFGGESAIPGDFGITGSIDRVTGDAWYMTFTRGKDKKLKRHEMFDLVCKSTH